VAKKLMSGAAHCAICLNHCPLDADRFAIFPCGMSDNFSFDLAGLLCSVPFRPGGDGPRRLLFSIYLSLAHPMSDISPDCAGHGFCTGCISRLFSEPRPKCPTCRCTLHRRDAHPVHIEFIDSHTVLETSVVEGLNQMDADTPPISVKKASHKLAKILEGSKGNDNLVRTTGIIQ